MFENLWVGFIDVVLVEYVVQILVMVGDFWVEYQIGVEVVL